MSVAPLRSLVVLRKSPGQNSSEGVSTANLDLDEKEVADLERYLDVTRGELLFARGVLLVEGDAELFLIPVLGKLNNFDFDELGITVCSVSGTNFLPYIKLLGPTGLDMPFAVLTDLDPQEGGSNLGETRVLRLLEDCMDQNDLKGKGRNELLDLAPQKGFFLNTYTLEVDLFRCGRHQRMCDSLMELSANEAARTRAKAWRATPESLDVEWLLKDITAISKGRFAQRLATRLGGKPCPRYILEAIKYVAERCG